jgi:hypothetical protein
VLEQEILKSSVTNVVKGIAMQMASTQEAACSSSLKRQITRKGETQSRWPKPFEFREGQGSPVASDARTSAQLRANEDCVHL